MRTDRDTAGRTREAIWPSVLGAIMMLGACAEGSSVQVVPTTKPDAGPPDAMVPTEAGPAGTMGDSGPPDGGSDTKMTSATTTCADIDWTKLQPLAQSTTDNLHTLKGTITKDCLYVRVEYNREDMDYGLLIDTDGSATTGFQNANWPGTGSDYLAQHSLLYRHDASDAKVPWKTQNAKTLTPTTSASSMEFRIPLGMLGNPSSVRIGFMLLGANSSVSGKIPSAGSFVTVGGASSVIDPERSGGSGVQPAKPTGAPDRSACRVPTSKVVMNTGAKFEFGEGMIVPAYLSTSDIRADVWEAMANRSFPAPFDDEGQMSVTLGGSTLGLSEAELNWVRLVQEAKKLGAESHDFIVIASGADNGPPTAREEWTVAVPVWESVQDNGGAVFGYVRTSKQASTPEFVALDQVMAQVDSWVRNFPEVDGIWLDQFRPRHELFAVEGSKFSAPTGCDASVMPPSYPNGACNAPGDASYLRADGCLDPAVAINPVGGYYHTLTQRIRTEYPGLAIIGNAGGRLAPNLLKYGSLVDVLVSYEDSLANAQSNWTLAKPESTSSVPQAALLHGTSSASMRSAIDQLTDSGYTHVYVTEQNANSTINVWGKLPSYLSNEASYVMLQY